MMKLSELLSRLMKWRKSQQANPPALDAAEQEYEHLCARERKKRMLVLEQRSAYLQTEIQRLQDQQQDVQLQLRSARASAEWKPARQIALPVPQVSQEEDHYDAVQEAKQNMAALLSELKNEQTDGQEQTSSKTLYNPDLLDQESDELLRYL